MKIYLFDDKGISTLVKTVIKKLFESPNYINMRKQISSLREDVDKVSVSSNGIVQCWSSNNFFNNQGIKFQFGYPAGFNKDNTIPISAYGTLYINGSTCPGYIGFDNVQLYDGDFYVYFDHNANYKFSSSSICLYLMKKPSV